MKKTKPITLPELVRLLGQNEVATAVGCDRTLPKKWERGQRPGWRNAEKLVDLAKARGYLLTILGGAR
jgi:hypothetical protein